MDDYKRLAIFAAVVSHGSMSAAARALGLSTSAVSQQVRALERDSGVTLLHRSTRKLDTTDAGARAFRSIATVHGRSIAARMSRLDDDELAALRDLTEKLRSR